MKLIIASNNAHKVREIKQILGGFFSEIATLKEAGLDIDVVEDGETFLDNALKKATEVLAAAAGFDAALSDDSGLIVDALGGAPGVHSARFAGDGHDDEANKRKLIDVMRDVPDGKRTARFTSAVALRYADGRVYTAQGYVEGRILHEEHGTGGFGYDPLFFYEPLGKSFAELTAEEKNNVSHRKNALEALKKQLEEK